MRIKLRTVAPSVSDQSLLLFLMDHLTDSTTIITMSMPSHFQISMEFRRDNATTSFLLQTLPWPDRYCCRARRHRLVAKPSLKWCGLSLHAVKMRIPANVIVQLGVASPDCLPDLYEIVGSEKKG